MLYAPGSARVRRAARSVFILELPMIRRVLLAGFALTLVAGCFPRSGPSEVRVSVTDDGFVPARVAVAKGQPVVLILTRKSDQTCATSAVFAETGRRYELPLGQDVRVEIPTDHADTLHYACGMDMYHGEIVVK